MTGKEKLLRKMIALSNEEIAHKITNGCPSHFFKSIGDHCPSAEADCEECWLKFLNTTFEKGGNQ